MLNRLLDGFFGKLTSSKYATLAKCSQDTALCDIRELLTLNVLTQSIEGGRSTSYELVDLTDTVIGARGSTTPCEIWGGAPSPKCR